MTAVVFLGSKAAGLALCRLMCEVLPPGMICGIICPDDGTDARSELPGFEAMASEHGIPLRVAANSAETKEALEEFSPKYAIVHGWYQLIPVDDFTGIEFFGFHYSPLPRYRGNAPLVWQIINGEKELGISFFRLSSGMDEGPLAGRATFELGRNDTIADALNLANTAMLDIARRILPRLVTAGVELIPQENAGASYCGMRIPEDGKIDWGRSAWSVHDFIRGQSKPYPGAFSMLSDGRVLRVWRSEIDPRTYYGVPGSVMEVNDDWVLLACGEGALRLHSVTVDGEPEQSSRYYLRSLKTRLK